MPPEVVVPEHEDVHERLEVVHPRRWKVVVEPASALLQDAEDQLLPLEAGNFGDVLRFGSGSTFLTGISIRPGINA